MSIDMYEHMLEQVWTRGRPKTDRTGTGTISLFGLQGRWDLTQGFPLVTTKYVPLRLIVLELLWFLRGETNAKWLQQRGCHIWDEWANANGYLGPVYGAQWRNWGANASDYNPSGAGIDQITKLVETIKTNPDSRRMLVSAWNVADLPVMALEPCHYAFQCYVIDGKLSMLVNQRSADMFLGVPFNIASYALLTHMLAQQCDLGVGELIWNGGDCHIYNNHFEQVELQLSREPYLPPKLIIERRPASLFDYDTFDFRMHDYQHHAAIKAPVAV